MVVADVCRLQTPFCRFETGKCNFIRVFEQSVRQLPLFLGHGGTKQQICRSLGRWNDLVDVISKPISIIRFHPGIGYRIWSNSNVAQIEVGNQLARCCYNDVNTLNQRFLLLIPARAISSSINGKVNGCPKNNQSPQFAGQSVSPIHELAQWSWLPGRTVFW